MKANTISSVRALLTRDVAASASERRAESAPIFVLAGGLITMLGIAAYIVAIGRTGEDALMLDAFIKQGALGWASAALLIGGVVMWFAGGLACLRSLSRTPREGHE